MDRRMLTVIALGVTATLGTAVVSQAQRRGPQGVPPGHRPPAGLCRVWYDGLPPGRQPPPTSCRDAERRAGRNARVIYGDVRRGAREDGRQDDRWDDRWDDRRDARRDAREDGRQDDRWDGRRDDRWDGRRDDRRDGRRDDRRDDRRDGRRDDRWDTEHDDRRRGGDWDDRDNGRRGDGWEFRRDGRPENERGEPGRSRVGSDGRGRTGGSVATSCTYVDANGRCLSTGRRDMPMMSRVRTLKGDQRSQMERYWLGDGAMRARYTDRDRNGVPEEVLWYDRRGALAQRWQDSDRDGRVDEIVIYRDGVARVIR